MDETRVAVIGAGPMGLEAALEGVARGFDVTIYEAGRIGEHLRRFRGVTLFTPFEMNSSNLGRARLRASGTALPPPDAILTAGELVGRYLEPLAALPELAGRLRERARVAQVGRDGLSKGRGIVAAGDRSREGRPFLLRVEGQGEPPRFESADAVIDATGVYGAPRATGPGGLPALGEEFLGARVDRHLPPVTEEARPRYARRRVLLVGGGHSAATALLDFQALAEEGDAARVTWVHPARPAGPAGPFAVLHDDPLPERRSLVTRANAIAREAAWLTRRPGASVESYETWDGAVRVMLSEPDGGIVDLEVDQVLALVGYVPDTAIARELQIHLCYASEAPMNLAAAILTASLASPGGNGDCLKQTSHGAETLRNPEPGFFIVGAKSYGRNPHFLLSVGFEQIRDVFDLIEAARAAPTASAAP